MDHATRYQNRPAQSLRPGEQPRAPGRTGVPAVCPRGAACEEEQRHDLCGEPHDVDGAIASRRSVFGDPCAHRTWAW